VEFELRISNDHRAIGLVEAFVRESLRLAPLRDTKFLEQLIVAAVRQVIDHAYPEGEAGAIVLHSQHGEDFLTISIRDFGLPEDLAQLEMALRNEASRSWIGHLPHVEAADNMHWIGYGPEGKALVITKSYHDTSIKEHPADLRPFEEKPPLAPEQDYMIRRMNAGDAVSISQLIYKAYGSSYFNRDVYYPERIAALNAKGAVVSFVAVAASGEVVGHYALERNQEGPVAEGGQAVVDPAHRGRRLLDRLKTTAIEHARDMGLAGVYADAVTVHKFTQKANIAMGAKVCCADLAISPKSETFRGIAAPASPQRVTCLLYYLSLKPRPARTIFVPAIYQEMVSQLLEQFGTPFTFGTSQSPTGHGVLRMQLTPGAGTAFLSASCIGADTFPSIRKAARDLIEHSHAETIFVDLPMQDAATPFLVAELRKTGFSFAGLAPEFSTSGDLLRLVYLVDELSVDLMQIEEPLARKLVEFALTDRKQILFD